MRRFVGVVVATVLMLMLGAALAKKKTNCRKWCESSKLLAALRRDKKKKTVRIPKKFPTDPLSEQLVLIKVPETGSSTASNLLSELARRRGVDNAWQGGAESFGERIVEARRDAPKWSLGHQPWGDWIAKSFQEPSVVTTVRDPMQRLVSHTEKRAARGEVHCPGEGCDCGRGVGVALRFWGVKSRHGLEALLEKRFDDVWITERYNESLVVFALRHRLRLGDVVPPLAKYHHRTTLEKKTGESTSTVGAAGGAPHPQQRQRRRALVVEACERGRFDLSLERAVHKAAVDRLDATLAHLRHLKVPVDRIVHTFNLFLDHALEHGTRLKTHDSVIGQREGTTTLPTNRTTRGRGENEGHPTTTTTNHGTLILDDCARRCVADTLDRTVVLTFDADEDDFRHNRSRRPPLLRPRVDD